MLQRQKDDTQLMLDSGKSPRAPQSLLPVETLRRLGDNLVAQADELERLGLVDYQMGVAEEEIITSKPAAPFKRTQSASRLCYDSLDRMY